ncbi:homeobox-leucine zipper protein REVOLUTA-like protein [Tanacetum coccineum]
MNYTMPIYTKSSHLAVFLLEGFGVLLQGKGLVNWQKRSPILYLVIAKEVPSGVKSLGVCQVARWATHIFRSSVKLLTGNMRKIREAVTVAPKGNGVDHLSYGPKFSTLQSQTSVYADKLEVNGRSVPKNLEGILKRYADKYVICSYCNSQATFLLKDSGVVFVRCKRIAQELSCEVVYGLGRKPALMRTPSQRLVRGFNDAINRLSDDG